MKMIKSESLQKGSINTILYNFIGKGIGFFSIFLISYFFGASRQTDVYYFLLSFSLLVSLLFSSVFSTVFLPLYLKIKSEYSEKDSQVFLNSLFGYILAASFFLCGLFIIFNSHILRLFSNFNSATIFDNKFIIIPFGITIFFLIISEFLRIVIQSYGQFTYPSKVTISSNFIIIPAIIMFRKDFGVLTLSISTAISYFLQTFFMFIYLKNRKHEFKISLKSSIHLQVFLKLSYPVFLAQILGSFSMFFYDFYATSFSAGILTAISFSQRIFSLPSEMIINPMSNVVGTSFSKISSTESSDNLLKNYLKYNNLIWFLIVPISIFFIIFSTQIINFFFFRGNFTSENVIVASNSLKYFSISLLGLSFVNINSKLIYSIQKTKLISLFSFLTGIISVVITSIICKKVGYIGISISRTLSVFFLSGLAGIYLLDKYFDNFNLKQLFVPLFKITFISSISCIISFLLYIPIYNSIAHFLGIKAALVLSLTFTFLFYLLIYIMFARIINLEELSQINFINKYYEKCSRFKFLIKK